VEVIERQRQNNRPVTIANIAELYPCSEKKVRTYLRLIPELKGMLSGDQRSRTRERAEIVECKRIIEAQWHELAARDEQIRKLLQQIKGS
jgi:ArsR family metal-binding transcriptional regulator